MWTLSWKTGFRFPKFFPRNARNESQWAAFDFDAHGGDRMRARNLAFKAFALLCHHDKLCPAS
jgi:hypothetical protein